MRPFYLHSFSLPSSFALDSKQKDLCLLRISLEINQWRFVRGTSLFKWIRKQIDKQLEMNHNIGISIKFELCFRFRFLLRESKGQILLSNLMRAME